MKIHLHLLSITDIEISQVVKHSLVSKDALTIHLVNIMAADAPKIRTTTTSAVITYNYITQNKPGCSQKWFDILIL